MKTWCFEKRDSIATSAQTWKKNDDSKIREENGDIETAQKYKGS